MRKEPVALVSMLLEKEHPELRAPQLSAFGCCKKTKCCKKYKKSKRCKTCPKK